MFKRWRKFLAKHRAAPEHSVPYRIAVTVLVLFALILTLHQLEWPSYWPAVLFLTIGASTMSYYRREESNLGLKIFLSFAMMALLLWFFMRLSRTLYDPRLPLAELLIWLQTLHAFDLPAKKDLRYTGLVSLILVAIACVLTYSSYFAPLLLIFCVLFLGVLAIDFWAGNRTPNTLIGLTSKKTAGQGLSFSWLAKTVLKSLPLAILGAGLIFLFMPRYQGLRLRSLPMSLDVKFNFGKVSNGQITNQNLPRKEVDSGGKPRRVDGDSYFGFDSEVNLNTRGRLSDSLVMKVRSSNWQYHRGVTFAEYTGYGWKGIPWEPKSRKIEKPPFFYPSVNWKDERVTIYYAETDLPNIVFTPSNPRRVYFPSDEMFSISSFEPGTLPKNSINTPATLVSPFYLETGVVYSVLNQIPETGVNILSRVKIPSEPGVRPEHLKPFLQLPETVTKRTRNKAMELVKNKTSPWARASMLSTHLQQNYTYDVGVDFYPEGVDTTDHFLFEAKVGYCEQFATSLCVMARSVGLPARYVTGYLPGKFNPVSGFYEVKASDAHAWTEIYLEGFGWMIFDPVPGGVGTPQVGDPPTNRWLLEALLEYLQVPDEIRKALPNLIRLFVGLAILTLLLVLFRRRTNKTVSASSAFVKYLNLAQGLTSPRPPGVTVKNWADSLTKHPELQTLSKIYEDAFYRGREITDQDRAELEKMMTALRQKRK